MQSKLGGLMAALALSGAMAGAQAATPAANEALTRRHLAGLLKTAQPGLAELTLFFTQMPKGGDLHHHYSGALYAEQYLEWVDRRGYCVNQHSYRIETAAAVIAAERALAPAERNCLSGQEVLANDQVYRELLQRWSDKDFDNHGAPQPPPDRQFFETFSYFNPVSNGHFELGLQTLKQRAIEENVSYIETMFKSPPSRPDGAFDQAVAEAGADQAALQARLRDWSEALERDPAFQQGVSDYIGKVTQAAAGIDDARFTMRYQAYVVRRLAPSQVFSSMLAGFKAASQSPLIVGVNIVGPENLHVSMRDYTLHMHMFGFLKARYPRVKLALHAGELALGMVPPEGLKFHIGQALEIAGADRIGHGVDLAHERDAAAILRRMRARDIPVEINLTSNDFILGVRGAAHPVTLYRKYGVPFVLSTDDAGVSRNNLAREYQLYASQYRPDYAELKKLSYDSLRYAFLAAPDKRRLLRELDVKFRRFEAGIAALHAAEVKP